MIFTLIGLITGFILNFFILIPHNGININPGFYSSYENIEKIEKSGLPDREGAGFPVKYAAGIYLVNGVGELVAKKDVSDGLTSVSGNGEFYTRYYKTGKSVELYNIKGERFWKIKSLEYPYISYSGKLILLVNGDHSRIRAVNENGQSILKDDIQGRFCTIVSFSDKSDTAAAGFLDGRFHVFSSGKGVIYSSRVPGDNIVKGLAISRDGEFISVYYGDTEKDTIRTIKLSDSSYTDIKLMSVRYTKAPLHVSDAGIVTLLESDSILNIGREGSLIFKILIPHARESFARISSNGSLYTVSYTMESGISKVIVFLSNGKIIYSREFDDEKYMDNITGNETIMLKGSQHIYCYRLSALYPL